MLSTPVYATKHWTQIEYAAVAARTPDRILLLDCGDLPEELPAGLVYRAFSPAEMVGLKAALQAKLKAGQP